MAIVGEIAQDPTEAPWAAVVRALDPIHGLLPLTQLGQENDDAVGQLPGRAAIDEGILLLGARQQRGQVPAPCSGLM
ncbi:MAG TPA: hypothetical protein VMH88_06635 [Gemmatimonadales bacterium]|nr:hypothetical protein [Gemmatimonadales bacterium]